MEMLSHGNLMKLPVLVLKLLPVAFWHSVVSDATEDRCFLHFLISHNLSLSGLMLHGCAEHLIDAGQI